MQNKVRWKGKQVEVEGFFVFMFERYAVYENESAARASKDKVSLWVDWHTQATSTKGKLVWPRWNYVRIVGTFDYHPDEGVGHFGRWPARLRDIESVEVIKQEEHELPAKVYKQDSEPTLRTNSPPTTLNGATLPKTRKRGAGVEPYIFEA
jgi:hypothetical protein